MVLERLQRGLFEFDFSLSPDEAVAFWEGIWSSPVHYNAQAEWVKSVSRELSEVPQQEEVCITLTDVQQFLTRMPYWKAPGPDGVQWFWFKRFEALHAVMARELNRCLQRAVIPAWMNHGRTVLIMKDPAKGAADATNYRPITCLPVMWKLFSGILSNKIYAHLESESLLTEEQKGCRRGAYGTKDQLVIDMATMADSKKRRTNLAMAWVDYKKAYDMVPHDWILRCLELFAVHKSIRTLMAASMSQWKVDLWSGRDNLGSVAIQRGIFQGDSLSPLLFVICLIPITLVLRKAEAAYCFGNQDRTRLNHLWYMDDLKLFAKNNNSLHSLLHTVHTCSQDIGMQFGVSKCATLVLSRGKYAASEGVHLPHQTVIRALQPDETYKYLGFAEAEGVHEADMKTRLMRDYEWRVRRVLRSSLNGHNTMTAINTWAVSLIRYSAGILTWTQEELRSADTRTRKLLNMHGALHPRADVHRLYVSRKQGGRGLISIHDAVTLERSNLQRYVLSSDEDLLRVASSILWPRLQTPPDSSCSMKKRLEDDHYLAWTQKPLHGQFVQQTEQFTNDNTFRWLTKAGLKKGTESLIIAAQDQALATNLLKARVFRVNNHSPLCRMCLKADESVAHILCQCSKLAGQDYLERHNRLASLIHWSLCRVHGIPCADKSYNHQVDKVLEHTPTNASLERQDPDEDTTNSDSSRGYNKIKLLWDFTIQCDRFIEHRRPDIVLVDGPGNRTLIIDIAIPGDPRVVDKEVEKREKYQLLSREIHRLWQTKVQVVPIVVGTLGTVSKQLTNYLEILGIQQHCSVTELQKTALLGSATILRKVLGL